ncbi:MAG TPA: A/G-specific adenine glycosylase [Edaphocola sp.]|nr:A/G-specific adenine glycosylase [Edaphocola sp.]
MEPNQQTIAFFQRQILIWHHTGNPREHPWTKEQDPYRIWLAEIIMQQTQVAQGLPYYLKFVERYPDIRSLANARDEEVFLLWQGLGYYSRCRNLLSAARYIDRELNGNFPKNYKDVLALKGVGQYTAAAIVSFAYGLPYAVLDGNVFRVLSRFFALDAPIDDNASKKVFQELADHLLPADNAATYNQAIMDFGAVICKPKKPLCQDCLLAPGCKAKALDIVEDLPVKQKKLAVKERYFQYFILQYGNEFYVQQRTGKDIWQNLFEFYLIESENFHQHPGWLLLKPYVTQPPLPVFQGRQRLTHQLIHSYFHNLQLSGKPTFLNNGLWLKAENLRQCAFPKTILAFMDNMVPA